MKMNQWLITACVVAGVSLGAGDLLAQNNNNNNNNPGGRGRGGRGNFDPAQIQQRIMDNFKQELEITDDAEWNAVQPLIQKVLDLRRQGMSGMGRGMFGRNRGGNNNNQPSDQNRQRGGFFGQPNPDLEALEKAIDGKASNSEMKAAIAKYEEARKARQAELEKAQANLRKVLSVRQEAILLANGVL
jgi:hypothetical protein